VESHFVPHPWESVLPKFAGPAYTQKIIFSRHDASFFNPLEKFFVILTYPNGLDPDSPMKLLPDWTFAFYKNQSVPNLYLEISRLTGFFPWSIRLMVGDKILSHRGLISAEFVLGRDTAVLGPCPALTPDCILTVIVLCSKGCAVPMGSGEVPVGFPLSFPPYGMTAHILHLD
jgi:hypothetical protein